MADYVVRVEASTEEAEKKLKRVDEKVVKLEKGATIDIRLPSASQTLNTLQQIGSATAGVAKQALQISRALNVGPGARINDIQTLFDLVGGGAKKTVSALELLSKATPTNILGTAFSTASDQALNLAKRISNVGYEIFGLTQSVNILRQAFGGMFDETIGREIRLQESLLRTRTTLVSTADVAVNGKRLTDPYDALIALEKPVEKTIESIRRRSLDIAGTTSDAIVQVFGVVASQVGQFGGSLKDAEDLAITFAGALGTIGMSDPTLATQEIRSILTGNIDQNSVLARSLGLTNEEITKAKTSTEGLVGFLQRRLAAFTAGQSIAAKGFAGITSNIAEVREEALRSLGKPLLQPLLESLTQVYTRLQLVFDQILKIADGFGRIGSSVFSGVVSGVKAAPVLQNFSERDQIGAFKATEETVAQAAVKIQSAVDGVRPIIARVANEIIKAFAMVSSGLATLAVGFAKFKFEQLKIVAINFANIASTLNSTLIPALTAVLQLYGKILEQPVFQFLSQVNLNLQLLEKAGVLPVVRLGIAFAGIVGSVKVVLGWIKTAADVIKTAVSSIINTIAGGIQGLGNAVKTGGELIVSAVATTATRIILLIGDLFRRIGVFLVNFAVQLQAQNPALGQLAVGISTVGRAFVNIDKGAQKAGQAIKKFSQDAKANLEQVARAAERAADKTRNIGTTIGTFAGEKLKGLAGFLKENLIGLIKFQAILFLIEKGIGFVITAIQQLRRADTEASEQTRAELAVQRLSTVYADLGENASGAAKALKQAEQDIVNNRISNVTKQYTELNEKLREISSLQKPKNFGDYARSTFAMLNPANFDIKPKMTGKGTQETFVNALVRQRREEAIKLKRELDSLTEFENKQKQQTNDQENVQVLARQRKDIENAIAEFRKEIEKDLADERFKTVREAAQLEQQLAEENRRIERAELDRRLARQADGLTGVQAQIAQILGDYERGLFDAQTEAQKKQFEAAEARENLEKSIADYKLKLEEQTTKMRKRIGDYNKEVADYESAQAERRNKERIKTALQAAAIEAERFVLGPEETRKFKDAAFAKGVSDTQALSLLKTPGVIEQLGVTPGGDYNSLISAMLRHPMIGKILTLPSGKFIEYLNNRNKNLGAGAGQYTYDTASAELGNQRYFQRKTPAPPKLKGFADFSKEQSQFVAERRSLGEQILSQRERLNEVINQGNLKLNYAQTIEKLNNVALFTDLPSIKAATQSLEDLTDQLRLLQQAADAGATKVDPVTERLAALTRTAPRAAEQFVISSSEFNKLSTKDRERVAKAFSESLEQSIKAGKEVFTPELREATKLLPKELTAMMLTVIGTAVNARKRIEQVAPILDRIERIQQGVDEYKSFIGENKTFVRDNKLQAIQGLGQLAAGNSPLRGRQFEAELINMRRYFSFQDRGMLQDPENVALLQKMNAATKGSYEELGKFEEALKNATARMELAENLAKSMSEGYKRIFSEGLRGGDIKTLFNDMLTGMQETLVGSFLDYAMRPAMEQMKNQFLKILKAPSAEELAQQYRDTLLKDNNSYISDLGLKLAENTRALNSNTAALTTPTATGVGGPDMPENANTSGLKYGIKIGDTVGGPEFAPKPKPYTAPSTVKPKSDYNLPAVYSDEAIQDAGAQLANDLTAVEAKTKELKVVSNKSAEQFGQMQKVVGGLVQGFSAIAMGISGFNQIGEGGTYNTLMGLAGIFGALGSITGMFGVGGIFAPKGKAVGGPVNSMNPYIVGEKGPELFVPSGNGTIIPNNKLSQDPYAATASYLSKGSALNRSIKFEPIKLETRVINGVEYATTDQVHEATRQAEIRGAERGRSLALSSLKNSVRTRRQVGI